METLVYLIISIALELGVPPSFALAVALTENPELNPRAVSRVNENGSVDRGVMQLNSYVYPNIEWHNAEVNIRLGILHIRRLMNVCHTYWAVAVAYNCGLSRLHNPPELSIIYANEVMRKTNELHNGYFNTVIRGGR